MTYKSVTHTINDMIAEKKRTDIQNVPRNKKTPRTELPLVGRPDNKRDDGTQTKQDEVQTKIIDETKIAEKKIKPEELKHPKKVEIEDIGKLPPTQVDISPELEKANIYAHTEPKGKLTEDDKPDEKSRKEAEAIAKFARQFQGKSFGGFKVTGKLTDKDIEQGARIRARLNALRKEETISEDDIRARIQYQTNAGVWVDALTTSGKASDIIKGMQTVQKSHGRNRVRALNSQGILIDMLPFDKPVELSNEEIERIKQIDEGGWYDIDGNFHPEAENSGSEGNPAVGVGLLTAYLLNRSANKRNRELIAAIQNKDAPSAERETRKAGFMDRWKKSLNPFSKVWTHKEQVEEEKKSYDVPERFRAKKDTDTEWRGGGMAQPAVKIAEKIYKKIKSKKDVKEGEEYTGRILPFSIDKKGKRSLSVPDWIGGSIKYTGEVMRGETDPKDPANVGRNLAMAAVAATSAMPPFKAVSGAIAPEPVAAFQVLGGKPKEKAAKPGTVRLQSETEPEGELTELKKETLERAKAKAEVTPQKDARAMKKIWQGIVWPAEARLSGRRMMPKKRGGYRRYHFDEEKLNEYEGLGIGAMRRWRQRPSDHKPASGWGGYGKPAKPKREQRNTMYPDMEKVYGAFKRQYEETLGETSVKELKKAKERTANAWLDNKPKSLENFKQVMKALRKKELEEAKKYQDTASEPKFSNSIQKVAAHTKWNAGAVHTYRHADGSKTRVNQELGEKIHDLIHSTPHRHRADIVERIHQSSEGLDHVLKHGWHGLRRK